jgi:Fe-S cluster assembly protein SufB
VRTSGNPDELIEVTEDHPFYASRRKTEHEKNNVFPLEWYPIKHLKKNDYLTMPVLKATQDCEVRIFKVSYKNKTTEVTVPLTPDFFRLIGYYLAEGSVDDRGDLNFSFNIKEGEYVEDIKNIVYQLFNCVNFYESTYKDRNGRDLRVCDARIARLFKEFGTHCELKHIPEWVMTAPAEAQRNLVIGYYRGDGNYYRKLNKYGLKELFRVNTVSEELAYQVRDILLRLGVVAFINKRNRSKEGRRAMYTIGIGGHQMLAFGNIVGNKVVERIGSHKRASRFHVDGNFGYMPVETLTKRYVTNVPVYNFSVSEDESYVVNGFAVHNCSAPVYTSDSLHAAVVEVIVKPGARMRYTTIQNWSNDVYNLVTKRARVEKNGIMEWVDGNIGAKVTMKYPSCYLVGEGARGEVLSLAYASSGMHQDAGAKMMHLAPNTSSRIISKSVSAKGGRTSYRGLVQISPMAKNSKSHVECDALILDPKSASDTFPVMRIDESSAQVEHEASVSKIGEEQLFYLESRGLTDQEARSLIISGFVEPIVKELPMEYAVELNRLIEMEMEGSVG